MAEATWQMTGVRNLMYDALEKHLSFRVGLADDLLDSLEEMGGYLSGSIVMQAVLATHWSDSDIDLFVTRPPKNASTTTVQLPSRIANDFHVPQRKSRDDIVSTYHHDLPIDYTVNYSTCPHRCSSSQELQVIVVNADVPEFVRKFVDLSFCKVIYSPADGGTISGYGPYKDLLTKTGTVDNVATYQRSRLEKYVGRGFRITNIDLLT